MSLKRDKICPQCEHRKLWRIDKVRLIHANTAAPAPLAVALDGSIWRGFHERGSFETFICAKCGFTEWYADGLSDLRPDPQQGIHFIDDEPKAGLR